MRLLFLYSKSLCLRECTAGVQELGRGTAAAPRPGSRNPVMHSCGHGGEFRKKGRLAQG